MSTVGTSPTAWIASAPSRWKVSPLGTHFDERRETVDDVAFPPLSVTLAGVVPQLEHVAKTDNNSNRKLVRTGDFVINSRSDRKGSAGLSELNGSVSVIYTILTPRQSVNGRFIHHLLRSTAFQEEFYRWGSGIVADLWSTRYAAMKRIPLALPPHDEQLAIANYLDRETAKIDALISRQRELIALLQERRLGAIASAAGTDSGGETIQLRRIAELSTGTTPTGGVGGGSFTDEGVVGWVTPEDLRATITPSRFPNTATLKKMTVVPACSSLICGIGASIGKVGFTESPVTTNQQITSAIPRKGVFGRYLYYAMAAEREQLLANAVTSTLPIISNSRLGSLTIKSCSFAEQKRIANQLDGVIGKIDTLIAKAEEHIALAKERRSALITAAVTGQIDVRTAAQKAS